MTAAHNQLHEDDNYAAYDPQIDAEAQTLGLLMRWPDLGDVLEGLKTEYFTHAYHQDVFDTLCELHASGQELTPLAVLLRWQNAGRDLTPQDRAVLFSMFTNVSVLVDLEDTIPMLRDQYALREAEKALTLRSADETFNRFDEIRADVYEARKREGVGLMGFDDAIEVATKGIEASIRGDENTVIPTTGLSDLDRALGGHIRGALTIVAGRPGMGKTAFAISSARQCAKAGFKVAFFSMEIQSEQAAARAVSDYLYDSQVGLSFRDIINHTIDIDQYETYRDACKAISETPLKISGENGMTLSRIAAQCRRHKERHGLDVIFLDQLGFIRATDRYRSNKVYEIGEITRGLKELAKELNISVVLLTQLNREVEKRDNKRPVLSDLRESGNIEQDADNALLLFRPEYYHDAESEALRTLAMTEQNILEIIIAKQRTGATRTVRVYCSVAENAVRDMGYR